MQASNVERRNFAWFALVDREQCRLLCCRLTREGTQHVEERGVLKNALFEREHADRVTHGDAAQENEATERRFAADTADWLNKRAAEHEMSRLVVFAPPRMLGLLRQSSFNVANGHMEEVRDDLMGLDPGQLADHPTINEVVRGRHWR